MLVLEAAKEWGVPPWVVEAECSQEWWARWRCRREEFANRPKSQGKSKVVGETVAPTTGEI